MPLPLLPLLLLGGGAAAAVALSSSKKSATPKPSPVDAALDANMPANIAAGVRGALANENDPKILRKLANDLRATYPLAAAALDAKATVIEASKGGGLQPTSYDPSDPLISHDVSASDPNAGQQSTGRVPADAIDQGMPAKDVAYLEATANEADPVILGAMSHAYAQAGWHHAANWLYNRATEDVPRYLTPQQPHLPPYLTEANTVAHPADALDQELIADEKTTALVLLANALTLDELGAAHVFYDNSGHPKTAALFQEKFDAQASFRADNGLSSSVTVHDDPDKNVPIVSGLVAQHAQNFRKAGVAVKMPPRGAGGGSVYQVPGQPKQISGIRGTLGIIGGLKAGPRKINL